MSYDWYKDCRNQRIIKYVSQGMSYAEISRQPNIRLSVHRITEIVTSCPNYRSIAADRDNAREQKVAENVAQDYKAVRTEKEKRLTPDKLKKMSDSKLLWHENKIIGQLKTKSQMIAVIEMLLARVEVLENKMQEK